MMEVADDGGCTLRGHQMVKVAHTTTHVTHYMPSGGTSVTCDPLSDLLSANIS
jgi:hypothetical protein